MGTHDTPLERAIAETGIRRRDFARLCGLTHQYFDNWRTGRATPTKSSRRLILMVLAGCGVDRTEADLWPTEPKE